MTTATCKVKYRLPIVLKLSFKLNNSTFFCYILKKRYLFERRLFYHLCKSTIFRYIPVLVLHSYLAPSGWKVLFDIEEPWILSTSTKTVHETLRF